MKTRLKKLCESAESLAFIEVDGIMYYVKYADVDQKEILCLYIEDDAVQEEYTFTFKELLKNNDVRFYELSEVKI